MKKLSFTFLVSLVFLLSACSQTQVKKVDDTHYVLTHSYTDTPGDLSSHALASRSDELCPSGYHVTSKNAAKSSEFGYSDAQCAASKNCDYVLEWRIHCTEKPKEKFSIFGKH